MDSNPKRIAVSVVVIPIKLWPDFSYRIGFTAAIMRMKPQKMGYFGKGAGAILEGGK